MVSFGGLSSESWAQGIAGINGAACSYASIQDAIDNATWGDSIFVVPGTYVESLTITHKLKLQTAEPTSNCGTAVTTPGSYAIVSPPSGQRGLHVETSHEVVTLSDMSFVYGEATTVGGNIYSVDTDLFVVRGGVTNGSAGILGGGIHGTGGSLVITDASVTGNESGAWGGGIYWTGGDVTLEGNALLAYNETVEGGGGLAVFDGGSVIVRGDAVVRANDSTGSSLANSGGGCVAVHGVTQFEVSSNALIEDCDSAAAGGAIYVGAVGTVVWIHGNALIQNSEADDDGGLVYAQQTQNFWIEDNARLASGTSKFGFGGLVALLGGNLEVFDAALLEGGRAYYGGGIFVGSLGLIHPGQLEIRSGAVLRSNTARFDGGAVYLDAAFYTQTGLSQIGQLDHPNMAEHGAGIYATNGSEVVVGDENSVVELDGAGLEPDLDGPQATTSIAYNVATKKGGGIEVDDSELNTYRAVIYKNRAVGGVGEGAGGGVAVGNGSTAMLLDSLVQGNRARVRGGGVHVADATLSVWGEVTDTWCSRLLSWDNRYCSELYANQAGRPSDPSSGIGGAAYVGDGGVLQVLYTGVQLSAAQKDAPHVYVDEGGSASFSQSLFADIEPLWPATEGVVVLGDLEAWGNTFGGEGTSVQFATSSTGDMSGNIVWPDGAGGNGVTVASGATALGSYNLGMGVTALTGSNNAVADPLFTTMSRGYYRLDELSPAIDGHPLGTSPLDLDRCGRPYNLSDVDMGAFEWTDGTCYP